jgi:hypothetical protein
VPPAQRLEWKQEWEAEIWHRWRFFLDAGEWNGRATVHLVRSCLGSFYDAAWHFAAQESVQDRLRECARSPWTCLAVAGTLLLISIAATGGIPATRELLRPVFHKNTDRLMIISIRSEGGRRERGFHPEVVQVWRKESRLLDSLVPFRFGKLEMRLPDGRTAHPLVITTEPGLFKVLRTRLEQGSLSSEPSIVLDVRSWKSLFHGHPEALGASVTVAGRRYRVAGILPSDVEFLSRQPTCYLVKSQLSSDPAMIDDRVMIAALARTGATEEAIDRELTKSAREADYDFWGSALRLTFLEDTLLTPLHFFGIAIFPSALIVMALCRVRVLRLRFDLKPASFFLGKVSIALATVFAVFLEMSRPTSSLLLSWRDGASGPTLVWLYIAGSMGVWFWALADQRARCRVCLRLLCFPVRVGCPGCLLLDWAGTELACTEGHGFLHVPDMATSWEEESDRWISLDESWRGLFARSE